jgi:CheY-like chemotaxis protein
VGGQPAGWEGRDETGHMLVVDDSSINRRLLVGALQKLGHEVSTAENGLRALELLRSDRFDVVLLDLLMPVMDGFTTLQTIKEDKTLRHLPVIMISAVHELESLVRCIELGAADYLPKPFSAAVLRARLRASLAAKRLRDLELDYLHRVDEVVDTAAATDPGPDETTRLDREAGRDDVVGKLARRLQRLTRDVQAREMSLRREIAQLRAEIDAGRRA